MEKTVLQYLNLGSFNAQFNGIDALVRIEHISKTVCLHIDRLVPPHM